MTSQHKVQHHMSQCRSPQSLDRSLPQGPICFQTWARSPASPSFMGEQETGTELHVVEKEGLRAGILEMSMTIHTSTTDQ